MTGCCRAPSGVWPWHYFAQLLHGGNPGDDLGRNMACRLELGARQHSGTFVVRKVGQAATTSILWVVSAEAASEGPGLRAAGSQPFPAGIAVKNT